MNTAQNGAAGFATIACPPSDTIVRRAGWRCRTQFWFCVTMSCLLLLHGAWSLARLHQLPAESLERSVSVMFAIVDGMTLPAFVYFACQARRQRKSAPAATIGR